MSEKLAHRTNVGRYEGTRVREFERTRVAGRREPVFTVSLRHAIRRRAEGQTDQHGGPRWSLTLQTTWRHQTAANWPINWLADGPTVRPMETRLVWNRPMLAERDSRAHLSPPWESSAKRIDNREAIKLGQSGTPATRLFSGFSIDRIPRALYLRTGFPNSWTSTPDGSDRQHRVGSRRPGRGNLPDRQFIDENFSGPLQ